MLETLVLVANDQGAAFCRSSNGVTYLIQKIACNCQKSGDHDESADDFVGKDRSARGKFAGELIGMLAHHAEGHSYDCAIILADTSIYNDLRWARDCKLSRLPIAHFIVPEAAPRIVQ